MAVLDKDLRENTTPANGTNPDAVKEAQDHAAAQASATPAAAPKKAAAEWVSITSPVLISQAAQGQIVVKADGEFTDKAGVKHTVKAGMRLFPLQRNTDASVYMCLVQAAPFNQSLTYPVPTILIKFGNAVGAPTVRARANDINDDLAAACKDLVNKIGKIPQFRFTRNEKGEMVFETRKNAEGKDEKIPLATKDYTEADWAQRFPGCTLGNIQEAFRAIQAFRAHRMALIETAITSKDDAAIQRALAEYSRAKSWEQDVISTAGNCGVL